MARLPVSRRNARVPMSQGFLEEHGGKIDGFATRRIPQGQALRVHRTIPSYFFGKIVVIARELSRNETSCPDPGPGASSFSPPTSWPNAAAPTNDE